MNTTEMIVELQKHPFGTIATHPRLEKVEFRRGWSLLFWADYSSSPVSVSPEFILAEGWEIELPPIPQGSEVVVKGFVYEGPDRNNRYRVRDGNGMDQWVKRENFKLAEETQ
jgi:hypothetical protein